MDDSSDSTGELRGVTCWQWIAVCLAASAILTLIAWPLVVATRRSVDSEYTLHALVCVAYVVEEFMETHDGTWPSSWEELEQTSPEHIPSMYDWPEDAAEVRKRVAIDFDVDEARLADPAFNVTSVISVKVDYIYDPATRLATLQEYIEHQRPAQGGED